MSDQSEVMIPKCERRNKLNKSDNKNSKTLEDETNDKTLHKKLQIAQYEPNNKMR